MKHKKADRQDIGMLRPGLPEGKKVVARNEKPTLKSLNTIDLLKDSARAARRRRLAGRHKKHVFF